MQKSKTVPNNVKFEIRPASFEEAGLFYALQPEQDEALGAIGHVRMDFGRSGSEFWHSWHPRGPAELNSPEFKAELQELVDELRKGVLKNFAAMTGYCRGHGGEISGGWVQNYGYILETENYRYCLRCNPVPGDYQAYLICFDKQVQEMNQTNQPDQGMQMGGMENVYPQRMVGVSSGTVSRRLQSQAQRDERPLRAGPSRHHGHAGLHR